MKSEDPIVAMSVQFAILSLISFGGGSSVLPEMHRFVVETRGWLDDTNFVELFTIGRAAPGPNIMFVTLIGWEVAGFLGALAISLAMCVPSAVVAFAFVRVWERFPSVVWRRAVQGVLAWLAGGFMLASGYVLTLAADHSWLAFAVTAVTTVLAATTKMHPLWPIGVAAVLGIVGWI